MKRRSNTNFTQIHVSLPLNVLKNIKDSVYFIENISYADILELAKGRLRKIWDTKIAFELLSKTFYDFNRMRTFIKSRNREVKISSYEDMNNLSLRKATADDSEFAYQTMKAASRKYHVSCALLKMPLSPSFLSSYRC